MINIKEFLTRIKAFLGLTYYTSPLDQFLEKFDQEHPRLSRSQRFEVDKYKLIFEMRDDSNYPLPKKSFWANF